MQTYNNVLQVYGMHSSKEAVLSTSSSLGGSTDAVELKRVDIYLQHSHLLVNDGATAADLVGDSRSILLGFSDGSLQLYSWQTKVQAALRWASVVQAWGRKLPVAGCVTHKVSGCSYGGRCHHWSGRRAAHWNPNAAVWEACRGGQPCLKEAARSRNAGRFNLSSANIASQAAQVCPFGSTAWLNMSRQSITGREASIATRLLRYFKADF